MTYAVEAATPCPLCGAMDAGRLRCDACQALREVAGYALIGPLATGGTSRVFTGKRISDGEDAAVKILELSKAADWKAYDLFARGTQTLQALSHPGLPRVFAFERDELGRLYQVRERFEGGTLRERIESLQGLPSAAVARQLLIALLRVLQYLHGRLPPVVHRDIKPSNVMFRRAGSWEPVLIDFESIALAQASTGTTIVVSPGYTAPEQLGGRSTPQSDLYSLAATFLYACTGKEPDEVLRSRRTTAALFDRLDPGTAEVLRKMLEPIPEQRLASATQALRLLDQPPAEITRLMEPSPLARVARFALPAALACLLVFAGVSIGGRARENQFKQAVAGLGLDFASTTDRVIVQSAKGLAADLGMGISNCAVTRHRLRGDSYEFLMQQLEAIDIDPATVQRPANGDSFVVLGCDLTPYPSFPFSSTHVTFTFRSAYGVYVN